MDNQKIKQMFATAAVAKVKAADALGTKTTWSMDDQIKVAVAALAETVKDSVEPAEIEETYRAVYNHSAMCQTLEKAFAGTGHFVRVSKEKKTTNWMADLVKQAQEADAKG